MKDSKEIMIDITNMQDIQKLNQNQSIKYINLDIENPNLEVIYYLLENGSNYSYAEKTNDKKGYIYVSYDIFKKSELLLLEMINNIPIELNELEIARYLYITIGKNIGYDINALPDKNDTLTLKNISMINNIWGSIYFGKGTNLSMTKLFFYLCNFMNIKSKLMITSKLGYTKNLLTINKRDIIVDITQDIPYIQATFKTKNFLGFNDNIELDKKIGYIQDTYNEYKIEKSLKQLDYSKENIVKTILDKTSIILNIQNIKPIELGIIYENIFSKYCPNQKTKIYNLYMNHYPNKDHFILISDNDTYYSFNYYKDEFVEIKEKEIIKNIEDEVIGIYLNEQIPFIMNKATIYES